MDKAPEEPTLDEELDELDLALEVELETELELLRELLLTIELEELVLDELFLLLELATTLLELLEALTLETVLALEALLDMMELELVFCCAELELLPTVPPPLQAAKATCTVTTTKDVRKPFQYFISTSQSNQSAHPRDNCKTAQMSRSTDSRAASGAVQLSSDHQPTSISRTANGRADI